MRINGSLILIICAIILVGCNPLAKPGQDLYKKHCQNCHGMDGEGLKKLIPPLTNSNFLKEHAEDIPCWLRNGIDGEMTVGEHSYNQAMPAIPHLTNVEIANLVNYIRSNFGNDLDKLTIKDVDKALSKCN